MKTNCVKGNKRWLLFLGSLTLLLLALAKLFWLSSAPAGSSMPIPVPAPPESLARVENFTQGEYAQDDPRLVDYVRNHVLVPLSTMPYNISAKTPIAENPKKRKRKVRKRIGNKDKNRVTKFLKSNKKNISTSEKRTRNVKFNNSNKSISSNGFWVGAGAVDWHVHDPKLSTALLSFFKSEDTKSVLDLGAGTGTYARDFMNAGLFVNCYDGNPSTQEITEGRCTSMDLSKPIALSPADWVMSLEVGEHIPKQYEATFIDNLHRSNKYGVILSWAVVGQGGTGHVNRKPNKYIVEKFTRLGYSQDKITQKSLRNASSKNWFKNTIMVFRKGYRNHVLVPSSTMPYNITDKTPT